jgi:hypothetical protein
LHGVLALMVGIGYRTSGRLLLTVEIVMTSACVRSHGLALPLVVDGGSRRDFRASSSLNGVAQACAHVGMDEGRCGDVAGCFYAHPR